MNRAQQMDGAERGSGTVLALGLISVLATMLLFIVGLAGVSQAKQRASTAADLSALAAADVARGLKSGEPCEVANQLAHENGAEVLSCNAPENHEGTIDIRVASVIHGPFAFLGQAEAIARAGPPTG